MAALTGRMGAPRVVTIGENPTIGQMRAETGSYDYTVRPGALLIMRDDGSTFLEPPLASNPQASAVVMGIADIAGKQQIDGTANADGDGGAINDLENPIYLRAVAGNIGYFATGSGANEITSAHANKGRPCFAYDDNTLYLTSNGGTLPFAGLIGDVTDAGVQLINTAAVRAMAPLFVEGGGGIPGVTSNGTVRAVVTSLAANTESPAGTLTADANGALGTQDGITLVAGDEVFIPEGTTNLDSAELAGPYTVSVVGDGSTKFVLVRPVWWRDGSVISQASDIKIAEGTLYGGSTWRTFAAKGAVVGTNAPLAYPDYVGQAATLVAGTTTLSNVPLRSATKSTLSINRTTANTASSTVQYNPSTLTAGVLGTASIVVQGQVAAGTINASDVSTLNIGVRNW